MGARVLLFPEHSSSSPKSKLCFSVAKLRCDNAFTRAVLCQALTQPSTCTSEDKDLDNSKHIEFTFGLEHICKALPEVSRCPALRLQGRDYSGRGSSNRKTMTKICLFIAASLETQEMHLGSKDKMKGAEQ